MCTAIADGNLFGRTLDLECSYGENIITTPRNYCFDFISEKSSVRHHAMIGVAHVADNVPLYYDAINEMGLGAAALNFPGYAVYNAARDGMHNLASFELIPWILHQCDSVDSAEKLLCRINVTQDSFSENLPATPLHWIFADKHRAITVEPARDGLKIYDNAVGVMTNSPEFPYHMTKLTEYMYLDSNPPCNTLAPTVELNRYSRGMGAIGLPGDYSSSSRFVRAAFTKNHTASASSAEDRISRFFHMMDTVSVPMGCVKTDEGRDVFTVYTSCGDLIGGCYYFTTYGCRRISVVGMHDFDLETETLIRVKMAEKENILQKSEK